MKIQIIGCGMVGSTIANEILIRFNPEVMKLVDIDVRKLKAENMEFERVIMINKLKTIVQIDDRLDNGYDWNIICLGERRTNKGYPRTNYLIVRDIVKQIFFGKILIVTNPAMEITREIKDEFPDMEINYAGDYVDSISDGKMIHELKGHTNWGIASEVSYIIRLFEGL